MKASSLLVLIFLFCDSLSAQQLYLDDSQPKPYPYKYSHLQMDINYLNYRIKNTSTDGFSVVGAAVFGNRIATGLSLDVTDSRKIPFIQSGTAVPNVFEYTQVSWYNEIFFHPDSRIDISLPLKIGLGHATVSPEKGFVIGETLFSNKNTLAGDFFFVSEVGVNVSIHLLRQLDFNIGGSYRVASGATGLVVNDDFLNYAIHAGLRFRIAGR